MNKTDNQESVSDSQIPYTGQGNRESEITFQELEIQKKRNKLPEYYTLQEFEEVEFNTRSIVEDYLYEANISIISAKPKVGKSTLQRYLARCLADGLDFLGRNTKQGKVLYLALEEPLANVQRDFKAMNVINKNNIAIAALIDEGDRFIAMKSLIEELKPSLVIVDTMVHITKISDLNDYIQTTVALKKIRNLAETYNCHISLVHHSRKGEAAGNDSLLGSTGLAGGVDLIQTLDMDSNKARLISSNGRSGENFNNTPLYFNESTMHFSLDDSYQTVPELKVLNAIKEIPGIFRAKLQKDLHIRSEALTQALKSLKDNNLIEIHKIEGKNAYFPKNSSSSEGVEV